MRYEAPTRLEDAVGLLRQSGAGVHVLAGGTDLLVRMRSGFTEPDLVIDIKRIADLNEIREEAGGFRIGAAVPSVALAAHSGLVAAWPGVVEAANLIGSMQIQSRATIAGNLCNASPAADSVPAMVAAGAQVSIIGPSGQREVPVEAFPTGPGKNVLEAGELVASIFLPARQARASDAYLRFIPRTEMDIAVVGVGVNLVFDETGICQAARVALGAVAPTVILAEDAGAALVGTPVDDSALDALASAASAAARPIDDKRGTREFRIKVAGVLARRAAVIARDRALAGC